MQEDYNRTPAQRLLKEIQEAKKHIPQLQEQLSKATGSAQLTSLLKVLRAILPENFLLGMCQTVLQLAFLKVIFSSIGQQDVLCRMLQK